MPQDKQAVRHLVPEDIILNTGKMQDASWLQKSRSIPVHNMEDLDDITAEACRRERQNN